jgi:hypothetical protein
MGTARPFKTTANIVFEPGFGERWERREHRTETPPCRTRSRSNMRYCLSGHLGPLVRRRQIVLLPRRMFLSCKRTLRREPRKRQAPAARLGGGRQVSDAIAYDAWSFRQVSFSGSPGDTKFRSYLLLGVSLRAEALDVCPLTNDTRPKVSCLKPGQALFSADPTPSARLPGPPPPPAQVSEIAC